MDLSIEPGVDFVEQINDAVGSCHLLIALIGPRWTTVEGADGQRRLADPRDFIRLEVEAALRRSEVRVISLLVDHDPPQVGDEIRVEFSLRNVGPNPIRFAETFIGARNPGGDKGDFAQENQGEVLDPEEAMEIDGARVLDAPGTWEFWPCYSLPRGGCLDEWESFQVAVGE